MRNAIILHGKPDKEEYYDIKYPSCSNSHWLPWLQKELLIHEISAHTPEIPHAFNPDYLVWKKELERYEITDETILVGHSCGGGFLIRWLSQHKNIAVGKVVLVAPWLDLDRESTNDFFNFEIDSTIPQRTTSFTIFHSDNDYQSIKKTVKILQNKIVDGKFQEFHNYGHFTFEDMKSLEFPELLKFILE
jgi:predicted alpha/beta hydrolase family esterase